MALIDDMAQTVVAAKELEAKLMAKMDPEEKAAYLAQRTFVAEEQLAKFTLERAKSDILAKFKDVEADDLADVTTVTAAEKLAARIQAKADKVKTSVQEEVNKALEGGLDAETWAKVKKATGRPREIQDTTQNLTSDGEQRKELGKQLEAQEKIEFGTVKGLETASRWAAGHALDRLLGKEQ